MTCGPERVFTLLSEDRFGPGAGCAQVSVSRRIKSPLHVFQHPPGPILFRPPAKSTRRRCAQEDAGASLTSGTVLERKHAERGSAGLALQPADLNGGRLFHRAVVLTVRLKL